MHLSIKRKIIEAIELAPSSRDLGDYLYKVAQSLRPQTHENTLKSLFDCMLDVLKEDQKRFSLKLTAPCFKQFSGGFFLHGGLHIIAGMTGHGKTVWSMNWCKEAAAQGYPSLVLSFEMTHDDMGAREVSQLSHLDLRKIMLNEIDEQQRLYLRDLVGEKEEMKQIYIQRFGTLDWYQIEPKLIENILKYKPKVIVVDYLQMLKDSDDDDGRYSSVLGNIARELKQIADQFDIAILVLSQLNRRADEDIRKMKSFEFGFIPMTHHYIKESGGIAEAADSVQMICIPEKLFNCPEELLSKFQVIVDKSRKLGAQNPALFNFDLKQMKFI